jgi:hypothetical protein
MQLHRPILINRFRAELMSNTELRMEGMISDDATREAVRQRLDEVHRHIVANRVHRFVVDVHALDYVDSSAIRLFIDLTGKATATSYVLAFQIDSRITWQRLSFSVLKTLAPERVELEEVRVRAPI